MAEDFHKKPFHFKDIVASEQSTKKAYFCKFYILIKILRLGILPTDRDETGSNKFLNIKRKPEIGSYIRKHSGIVLLIKNVGLRNVKF